MNQDNLVIEWILENPFQAAAGAVAAAALLLNVGNIRTGMAETTQIRNAIAPAQLATQKMLAEQQALKGREPIAKARYEGHCIAVFVLGSAGDYSPIVENIPVIAGGYAHLYEEGGDRHGQPPLPGHVIQPGLNACDADGNTAAIERNSEGLPIATKLASTTDREVIEAFLKANPGNRKAHVQR